MSEVSQQLDHAQIHMEKAIQHYEVELGKIRAGKASPQMLDSVRVEYYGNPVPLNQVGSINTPDAKTIVIQPWEKSMLKAIEQAIMYANIGFNPQDDGTVIRIALPPLTEERRKQLVKMAKEEAEHGRIAIRNIRKDINENIRRLIKNGTPEDEGKGGENKVQEMTDKYIKKIDDILSQKEKEILTV